VRVLPALVVVTAVWGVTFVQVKDAVAIYPLFGFLALRFAIAGCTLAVPAAARLRTLRRGGTDMLARASRDRHCEIVDETDLRALDDRARDGVELRRGDEGADRFRQRRHG